jgi:hypothetical protein
MSKISSFYTSIGNMKELVGVAPYTSVNQLHKDQLYNNPQRKAPLPRIDGMSYVGMKVLRPPSEIDAHTQNTMGFEKINTSAPKLNPTHRLDANKQKHRHYLIQ